jgi:hypothetical protein
MQSNRQTSPPVRQLATPSIYDTSRCNDTAAISRQALAVLNQSSPVENFNKAADWFY